VAFPALSSPLEPTPFAECVWDEALVSSFINLHFEIGSIT